jgi:hypothetical protein
MTLDDDVKMINKSGTYLSCLPPKFGPRLHNLILTVNFYDQPLNKNINYLKTIT